MSPAFLILLGIAIVNANDAKTAPPQPGTVRVAVVNVGYVFNKFHKAERFKHELEVAAKPYNDKAKEIQDDMKQWNLAIATKEYGGATKEEIEEKLIRAKRQLEDLASDMRKQLGKKSESNLVLLWKETQAAIDEYATKHGIELVLGYGDPLDKNLMDLFPNVNRKMNAMDAGGAVPLFMARRADISEQIVVSLNKHSVSSSPPVDVRNLPQAYTIKTRAFDLPVRMDAEFRATLSEVRLYVKTPGKEWKLQEAIGPNVDRFSCKVHADGEYWYLLVTVDKKGRTEPALIKDALPSQRAIVKTGQPGLPLPPSVNAPPGVSAPPLPPLPPGNDKEAKQTVKVGGFAPLTLPSTSEEFIFRAASFLQRGNVDGAFNDLAEAIRRSPNDPLPHRVRGNAWLLHREYDKAIADYTSALRIASKDTEAHVGRAAAWFRSRKFDLAINDLNVAIQLEPKNADHYAARAMVRYAMENTRDAIADLDISLRLNSADADVHFQRGKMHGEVGDYAKAIADFTIYIERNPKVGRGYSMRALAYFAMGDSTRGWNDAAKAAALGEP